MILHIHWSPFSEWGYQRKCVQFLWVIHWLHPFLCLPLRPSICFLCPGATAKRSEWRTWERFHKSQPQKAINNAWVRWRCVQRHVHNFYITAITTNHALPSMSPSLTNKHPQIHKVISQPIQLIPITSFMQSTPLYLLICAISISRTHRKQTNNDIVWFQIFAAKDKQRALMG